MHAATGSGSGRVVVIGGDAAGMSAASKIRREQPDRPIVVFERGPHTSYSACDMPYYIAGMVDDPQRLVSRSPETFRTKYKIDARVRHEVVRIEPGGRRVLVRALDTNTEAWEPFDQLLVATGAAPIRLDVPGRDAKGIFALNTLASGIAVRRYLDEARPRTAVIVGGGYIGLEMAEALLERGLTVSLVDGAAQVMRALDSDMGALVADALNEAGVALYLDEPAAGFDTDVNDHVTAVVTKRRTLPADVVILGIGVRPETSLAREAGITLGKSGAIAVSPRMETSVPGIWAAGDCAESFHLVSRRHVHVALGTVANKHGLVAGTNIAGGDAVFPGVVGTAVTRICRHEVARTGLTERECQSLGIDCATVTIRSGNRASYFPGAGEIVVKLIGERGTGRLLGAQIVGADGAAKRIDVMATALTAGMTAQNLVDLDLSYAPPFSTLWDPVQTAARQLVKAAGRKGTRQ